MKEGCNRKDDLFARINRLEDIGIDVFKYEKLLPMQCQRRSFNADCFGRQKFEASTLGIRILRRGVIGVSEVGYLSASIAKKGKYRHVHRIHTIFDQ